MTPGWVFRTGGTISKPIAYSTILRAVHEDFPIGNGRIHPVQKLDEQGKLACREQRSALFPRMLHAGHDRLAVGLARGRQLDRLAAVVGLVRPAADVT